MPKSRSWVDKIDAMQSRIQAMREQGTSWRDIAETIGVSYTRLRKKMDPDYIPRTLSIRERIRAQADTINAMREQGMTWNAIADALKVGITNLRYAMDQSWVDRSNELKREKRKMSQRARCAALKGHRSNHRIEEPREILGELPPPDTRDLTARLLGDPLPGRSYLDRMRAGQTA